MARARESRESARSTQVCVCVCAEVLLVRYGGQEGGKTPSLPLSLRIRCT